MAWRTLRYRTAGGAFRRKSQWTGPGVVVRHGGNTVWIGLRSRLVKASPVHCRDATNVEAAGGEVGPREEFQVLLDKIKGGSGVAVDIQHIPPPPDGEDHNFDWLDTEDFDPKEEEEQRADDAEDDFQYEATDPGE